MFVCACVCDGGAPQVGCSEFVSFYQVKEKGGGWCKIYLQSSENFDPRVVNLSKESSQLNRKHEEERKGGSGRAWYVFGWGVGGAAHRFKRGPFQSLGGRGGCPRHVYSRETDPSQLANLPAALPSPYRFVTPPEKNKRFFKNAIE